MAIELRLGVPLVMPHQCPCGAAVDKFGHHGLARKRSAGRHLRHNLLNDGVLRALQSAGVMAVREPRGLDRVGGKHPTGDSGSLGSRSLHAMGCDLLRHFGTVTVGGDAESTRATKYASLATVHQFFPVAFVTMGTWGACGFAFINDVGRRIATVKGDTWPTAFLKHRLALAVQRGNAASVLGTLSSASASDEH